MQMNLEEIKPVLLGAVCGGIVLAVIGFAWGERSEAQRIERRKFLEEK